MSYRFMRILVFFDLPTETANDRRNYRKFRKDLLKNGFFMMQESVYCRMVLNKTSEKTVVDNICRMRPPQGLVQVLTVTEKQFANMRYITGEKQCDVIDTDERVVIL
ncbi:MAG: CRISPR-associated endonuclease Cas2 [Selenomonas sp.]|nr:CRISPR-associated endonuclease Cas2 [Selenomonas sp.]